VLSGGGALPLLSRASRVARVDYTRKASPLAGRTGAALGTRLAKEKPMRLTIREIDHVVIRAADIEAMTRFYCDVLGCAVEKVQRELGLTQLRAGRSLIDLLAVGGPLDRPENGPPGTGSNMDHLCLRVDGFDEKALREHLASHGARIGEHARRYGADGFGQSLYLFDPEGNMVELKGPPEATVVTAL
jgi:glyoxylase I family protein